MLKASYLMMRVRYLQYNDLCFWSGPCSKGGPAPLVASILARGLWYIYMYSIALTNIY